MSVSNDAVCVPAKCELTKRDYYVMFYQAYNGRWTATYAKTGRSDVSSGDGPSASFSHSNIQTGSQYRCPHCNRRNWYSCCVCGKVNCYDGNSAIGREITCGNCGAGLHFTNEKVPDYDIGGTSRPGQG